MTMQRILTLGLLASWLVFGTSAAFAQDPAKLDAAKKSADAFIAMSKDAATTGKPPRYSEPEAKQLLDQVYDTSDIDLSKPTPPSAMQELSERMVVGVNVSLVYLLAGTGITELGQVGNDPAVIERVTRNTVDFAPEIGRIYDFQLKLEGAVVDAVMTRVATASTAVKANPKFQKGLADIRSGAVAIATGVVQTIVQEGMTDEWRRDRLLGLHELAPRFAAFLLPEQKAALRDVANEAAGMMSDEEVKKGLQTFAQNVSAS